MPIRSRQKLKNPRFTSFRNGGNGTLTTTILTKYGIAIPHSGSTGSLLEFVYQEESHRVWWDYPLPEKEKKKILIETINNIVNSAPNNAGMDVLSTGGTV